jgi:hypothetical protein
MSNRRETAHILQRLRRVKTWQLFVILLLMILVSATFLRLNNIGMIERRNAVLSADTTGNETALRNNLYALQRHASTHMNASSGTIYLEESYKREAMKLVEEAKKSSTVAKDVIEKADAACRAQFPGYSQAYVQCNASEQAKYAGSENVQSAITFPNPELYRHEYSSPFWSPDFAGLTVIICMLITGVIIVRLIMLGILRLLLHKHYSSI